MMPNCTFLEDEVLSGKRVPLRKENNALPLLPDKTKLPIHVAVIPDGNRRWAKEHALGMAQGHNKGADNVMSIVRAAKDFGIKHITFYIFSTENWSREKYEINALMFLLRRFLVSHRKDMIEEGIRLHTIGDLSKLSKQVNTVIRETKEATEHCREVDMILALNYGARDELKRAFLKILNDVKNNKVREQDVNEQLISGYLDTAPWPDPDLLIRTSGEHRMSNYLLWQLSYAELFVSQVLWPDFTTGHFLEALMCFQNRDRRLGGA